MQTYFGGSSDPSMNSYRRVLQKTMNKTIKKEILILCNAKTKVKHITLYNISARSPVVGQTGRPGPPLRPDSVTRIRAPGQWPCVWQCPRRRSGSQSSPARGRSPRNRATGSRYFVLLWI